MLRVKLVEFLRLSLKTPDGKIITSFSRGLNLLRPSDLLPGGLAALAHQPDLHPNLVNHRPHHPSTSRNPQKGTPAQLSYRGLNPHPVSSHYLR